QRNLHRDPTDLRGDRDDRDELADRIGLVTRYEDHWPATDRRGQLRPPHLTASHPKALRPARRGRSRGRVLPPRGAPGAGDIPRRTGASAAPLPRPRPDRG